MNKKKLTMPKRLSFKEFKFNSGKPTETFHVKEKALKYLFLVNHVMLYTDFSIKEFILPMMSKIYLIILWTRTLHIVFL